MNKLLLSTLLAASILTTPAFCGGAKEYAALTLGTAAIGNDDLEVFTPGISLGSRWESGAPGTEFFGEIGVTRNAYKEASPSIEFGITSSVANIGPGQVRAGFGVGAAYYKDLADELDEKNDYPSYNGYIPTISAKLSYRYDNMEVRASIMPTFGDDTSAISTFSLSTDF